ncbi:MAG TPA: GtrA family protein [Candidatus Izemoplasmatales bacterium]|nr:GtrA family protein [Candidatus Izemoplasmatales bacterium]
MFYNKLLIPIMNEALSAFLSNTVAFISASVFSYFANAFFTFKPKNRTTMQFTAVMGVFLTRLFISDALTTAFNSIILNWIGLDYAANELYSIIAPMMASILLIPIAYFALDYVFRVTDRKKSGN